MSLELNAFKLYSNCYNIVDFAQLIIPIAKTYHILTQRKWLLPNFYIMAYVKYKNHFFKFETTSNLKVINRLGSC